MSDLRSRLIRLAAAKPELRADLLPLLKDDADPASVDQNRPESYYGLPPRGVQAARRREDPNRVVLMVTTDRQVRASMADGSVESFLLVLSGLLTQQDKRESDREAKRPGGRVNIYRLGHYMRVLGEVRDAMKGRESSSDPADLEALKAAVVGAFTPGFAPVSALVKAVDRFLATGAAPAYPTMARRA